MNVRPKKHLGQHFLTDLNIAERIVDLLPDPKTSPVYEIGPGKGVLTQFLIRRKPDLHLLEVDTESITYLQHHYGDAGIHIYEQDVLTHDFQDRGEVPFSLIGNLPYNITSPILFQVLENKERFQYGVFMIQKEVADRICTPPGKRECGILSVLLSSYFIPVYRFTVNPGAFFPPPKVKSAVITLEPKTEMPEVPFHRLKTLVKTAFGQRRKTLRNALAGLQFRPSPELDALLTKRAEALTLDEFFWLEKQWL
jgi:16S rRNA (adenine1518-N6/adenine1519-N6)-dimethyltransferase